MKTFPFRLVLLPLCTALSLAGIGHAAAPASAPDPAPALLATINSVIDLASGQSAAAIMERLPQIRDKMSETFAIDAIVQRAFGRNWTKLSPAQQKEAVDLLGRLIIRTYVTPLSTGERPKIAVTSSKEIGPERREVVSTVAQDGKSANVIYRLAPVAGTWKVYEVLAENISVVGNYRQQFDTHFEKKPAEELLQTLRDKLAAPVTAEKAKG
ncbi:MAG: ABC transporter substrate-binding protein [Opitutaceae bacterium]